jgi:hypothetical protein
VQISADKVEKLHRLVDVLADIDAALEIVSVPLHEQHDVEIPHIRYADILVADDVDDAEYFLTPDGVRGPGYPPVP